MGRGQGRLPGGADWQAEARDSCPWEVRGGPGRAAEKGPCWPWCGCWQGSWGHGAHWDQLVTPPGGACHEVVLRRGGAGPAVCPRARRDRHVLLCGGHGGAGVCGGAATPLGSGCASEQRGAGLPGAGSGDEPELLRPVPQGVCRGEGCQPVLREEEPLAGQGVCAEGWQGQPSFWPGACLTPRPKPVLAHTLLRGSVLQAPPCQCPYGLLARQPLATSRDAGSA